MMRLGNAPLASLAIAMAVFGLAAEQSATRAVAQTARSASAPLAQIVAMRRLTESQYRNIIADVFGPDIQVAGRFEPIVRPTHQLIATGSAGSSISPAGFEQFDSLARVIAAQVFDDRHRAAFMTCQPRDAAQPDPDCARKVLAPLGRYLFRRPLTGEEAAFYADIAGKAAPQPGAFYKGLELGLAAMLVSPNFLYVIESAEPDPANPGTLRLDNFSRASRLSFLLWNTGPNEALLAAAEQGRLTRDPQLAQIAARMVASPRLDSGVRAFFSDMLMFEKFDNMAKDPIVFPRFNQEVAQALPEQLLRTIVDELVTRNGDYRGLFTTRRTFMTRALGPLYNVPVRAQKGWEAYEIPANDERAGLLGQAAFLALYSHSGRSSPTIRGRAIHEVLLCQPVPNPPGNVNFAVVQDTSNKLLRTARARLSAHANDPSCAGCHRITDPIGLALEKFDGIGAFRSEENQTPIDTSAQFENIRFDGTPGLGKALGADASATECVANRAFEYATGRPTDGETEVMAGLNRDFASSGYRIPALFLKIATMPGAYRVPRAPDQPPKVASLAARARGEAR